MSEEEKVEDILVEEVKPKKKSTKKQAEPIKVPEASFVFTQEIVDSWTRSSIARKVGTYGSVRLDTNVEDGRRARLVVMFVCRSLRRNGKAYMKENVAIYAPEFMSKSGKVGEYIEFVRL